jgi:hypothetical protein
MLTGPDDTNRIDRACVLLAVAVSLHCLAAPWLPPRMSSLAGGAAHGVCAALLALTSLVATVRGWGRHRSGRVVPWVAAGWILLSAARFGSGTGLGEVGEVLVTLMASVLLVVARQLNRSLAYWHGRS